MEQHIYEVLQIANTPATNREINEMIDYVEENTIATIEKKSNFKDSLEMLGYFAMWLSVMFAVFMGILIF